MLIELQHITKTYNLGEMSLDVLKDISLTVEAGEYLALMGASGSGKSTLMNILGCLDKPTSGNYFLDGKNVSNLSSDERALLRNKKIGFVFQSFNLLKGTTALENVMMPLLYTKDKEIERTGRARAKELLVKVGLGERMNHVPSQLSGGQQQRVAIARALINMPPVIFADEPTGNLDSVTSKEILAMFRELNEKDKITIILVTHDPAIGSQAGRVINVKDGRVI